MLPSLIRRRTAVAGASTATRSVSAAVGQALPPSAPLSPNDPKVYAVTYVPPMQQTRLTFRRADRGLYDGKTRITGNNVPDSKHKTRRSWTPNVQPVTLYSEALDQRIPLKATVSVLRKLEIDGGLDRYLLKSPPQKLGGLGLRLRSLVIAALRTRAALSNGFSTPIDPSQLWQIPQYQTPSERVHNEQKGMSPVKQGRGEEGEEKERMRTRMVQNRWQREVEVRLVREGEEPVIDSTAAGRQPDRRSTHPHRRLQ